MASTQRETDARAWWERPGLEAAGGRLTVAGRDAEALARRHGTPLYVFDLTHIEEMARSLQAALGRACLDYKVRFALKSNPSPEVLGALRALGSPGTRESVGVDVCSPGEVEHALAHGWLPGEISYTGTNVSERDLDVLLAHPIHINVDLISQLERLGRRDPGRVCGLRLNPRAGASHQYGGAQRSHGQDATRFGVYSSPKPTKFGIYPERLDEALAVARKHALTIDTAHFHLSHEILDEDLPAFEAAVSKAAEMVRHLLAAGCPLVEINAGGGLGNANVREERPLDLDAYAGILAEHLGPFGLTVSCEPGEFFAKWSAVFLAEVVTVEDRSGTTFVGVDAGWNANNTRFVYAEPIEIVPCAEPRRTTTERVTVAGHINEGPDLFAEDYPLAKVKEGDILAMLGSGCYAPATQTTHCLRPHAKIVFLADRLSV